MVSTRVSSCKRAGRFHQRPCAGTPGLEGNARLPRTAQGGPPPAPAQLPLPHPFSGRSHGSLPSPLGRRTCFSAQRGPRPQVPSLRTTRVKGRSATRVVEALLEQASTLSPKLGVPRERKRALQEAVTPTTCSIKTPGPASSWFVGHPDPTLFRLKTAPSTHKGQHTLACASPGSVRLFG